jgi:hypothetical protein
MSVSNFYKCDSQSRRSTEEDSSSEGEYEAGLAKTNPAKHKTELCKTFSELGCCPYEHKCRFAHGSHELVRPAHRAALKNRKCNGFWKNGCCSYGIRCQFGHAELPWETQAALFGLQSITQAKVPRFSKLLRQLPK